MWRINTLDFHDWFGLYISKSVVRTGRARSHMIHDYEIKCQHTKAIDTASRRYILYFEESIVTWSNFLTMNYNSGFSPMFEELWSSRWHVTYIYPFSEEELHQGSFIWIQTCRSFLLSFFFLIWTENIV